MGSPNYVSILYRLTAIALAPTLGLLLIAQYSVGYSANLPNTIETNFVTPSPSSSVTPSTTPTVEACDYSNVSTSAEVVIPEDYRAKTIEFRKFDPRQIDPFTDVLVRVTVDTSQVSADCSENISAGARLAVETSGDDYYIPINGAGDGEGYQAMGRTSESDSSITFELTVKGWKDGWGGLDLPSTGSASALTTEENDVEWMEKIRGSVTGTGRESRGHVKAEIEISDSKNDSSIDNLGEPIDVHMCVEILRPETAYGIRFAVMQADDINPSSGNTWTKNLFDHQEVIQKKNIEAIDPFRTLAKELGAFGYYIDLLKLPIQMTGEKNDAFGELPDGRRIPIVIPDDRALMNQSACGYLPNNYFYIHDLSQWPHFTADGGPIPLTPFIYLKDGNLRSDHYDGCGGSTGSIVGGTCHLNFKNVVLHELGHAMGALFEEYFVENPGKEPSAKEMRRASRNCESSSGSEKWEDVGDPGSLGIFGLGATGHAGCALYISDRFRPSHVSIMNDKYFTGGENRYNAYSCGRIVFFTLRNLVPVSFGSELDAAKYCLENYEVIGPNGVVGPTL